MSGSIQFGNQAMIAFHSALTSDASASMMRVFAPFIASAPALSPTNAIRPPRMASASAFGRVVSTV